MAIAIIKWSSVKASTANTKGIIAASRALSSSTQPNKKKIARRSCNRTIRATTSTIFGSCAQYPIRTSQTRTQAALSSRSSTKLKREISSIKTSMGNPTQVNKDSSRNKWGRVRKSKGRPKLDSKGREAQINKRHNQLKALNVLALKSQIEARQAAYTAKRSTCQAPSSQNKCRPQWRLANWARATKTQSRSNCRKSPQIAHRHETPGNQLAHVHNKTLSYLKQQYLNTTSSHQTFTKIHSPSTATNKSVASKTISEQVSLKSSRCNKTWWPTSSEESAGPCTTVNWNSACRPGGRPSLTRVFTNTMQLRALSPTSHQSMMTRPIWKIWNRQDK